MKNFYVELKDKNKYYNDPKSFILHPARILIVGSSGSGKTNCLLNILDLMNCFTKFYIFAKMLGSDPLYDDILIPKLEETEGKHGLSVLEIAENNLDNLPVVEDLDDKEQKIFIFDDLINSSSKELKQIGNYFCMARKKNCTLVFVTQNYFSSPKVVRNNVTTICITTIDSNKDLKLVASDIADCDFERFKAYYDKKDSTLIKTINEVGKNIYITNF